jgi:hypothetical protein
LALQDAVKAHAKDMKPGQMRWRAYGTVILQLAIEADGCVQVGVFTLEQAKAAVDCLQLCIDALEAEAEVDGG